MFYTLILENQSGEQLNLSTTANQYMTSKIEGLNPPAGTISTSSYAGMNGSYLNNAFIEKRNVVISFAMRGIGIEKRRHRLYTVGIFSMPITAASPEYFTFLFRRAMLRFLWACIPTATCSLSPMTGMKSDSPCESRHCPATSRRKWWQ